MKLYRPTKKILGELSIDEFQYIIGCKAGGDLNIATGGIISKFM